MKSCIYCHGETRVVHPKMFQCQDCGSYVAMEPQPDYGAGYHAYRFWRPKLFYLGLKAWRSGGSKLRAGDVVCDIGCGAGHALAFMSAAQGGLTTIGYDIPEAFRKVGNRMDFFYHNTVALTRAWANRCDLVWCWHTIEHTDRPEELIALAAALLKPGGQLYLEFPEANFMANKYRERLYENSTFPEHRGLPSEEWAIEACQRHGLSLRSTYSPRNPSWIYGKLVDDNADIVVHCRKPDGV